MKKIISILLASMLISAISTTAFAIEINPDSPQKSGETSVTFAVEPTYSVTIPSTINLAKQIDKTYAGSATILATPVRLVIGEKIGVFIQSDFEMETPQGAKQNYVVTIDGTSTAITNNQKVAEFSTSEVSQSVKLNFASANPMFAGDYSDIATFSIKIIE